jgi:hypothetical protein
VGKGMVWVIKKALGTGGDARGFGLCVGLWGLLGVGKGMVWVIKRPWEPIGVLKASMVSIFLAGAAGYLLGRSWGFIRCFSFWTTAEKKAWTTSGSNMMPARSRKSWGEWLAEICQFLVQGLHFRS